MSESKNGLALLEIGSKVETISAAAAEGVKAEIQKHFDGEGFVMAYLDDRLRMGRWKEEGFVFHDGEDIQMDRLQKLRVFNEKTELLFWRTGTGLKGRVRIDDAGGEGTHVVVAHQVLMGTRADDLGKGFTRIFEERATGLPIPIGNVRVDENKQRVRIKTHNYIGETGIGQATYVDCRFVAFTDGEKDLERGA